MRLRRVTIEQHLTNRLVRSTIPAVGSGSGQMQAAVDVEDHAGDEGVADQEGHRVGQFVRRAGTAQGCLAAGGFKQGLRLVVPPGRGDHPGATRR